MRGKTRREFLYGATMAVAATGVVAAAWPFIDQMNPDARTRAAGDVAEVRLSDLRAAQLRVARWHNLPIFVVRRTETMLAALQTQELARELIDPYSETPRQPRYAKNWHRSLDPAVAVLVGVCSHCSCVLHHIVEEGGYVCDCCAARYDAAGRARHGIARLNLAVPPYDIVGDTLRIGRNPPGVTFFFESIERG